MTMERERWAPVRGYESLYDVSDLGRVRSLDRATVGHLRETGTRCVRVIRGRLLRTQALPAGYLQVGLFRDGVRRQVYVHRLVLSAFIGEPPPGHEVCHGPGGPADNRLANLRWGTHAENQQDIVRAGTHYLLRRTHCPRGHPLSEPNLVGSALARGKRSCLACGRAYSTRRAAAAAGRLAPDLQELSDAKYAEIMGGLAA